MKLQSTKDYVLEQANVSQSSEEFELKVISHANFLNQKLDEPYYIDGVKCHPLNRFIPTDLEGNVLKRPNGFPEGGLPGAGWDESEQWVKDCREFQSAKERVLFDNCCLEYYGRGGCILFFGNTEIAIKNKDQKPFWKFKKAEHLVGVSSVVELTPTAKKLIEP